MSILIERERDLQRARWHALQGRGDYIQPKLGVINDQVT